MTAFLTESPGANLRGNPGRNLATQALPARILHEAFCCERRKHGILGQGEFWLSTESILEVRTRMYTIEEKLADK